METIQFTLPAPWASYLINGDPSGLNDDDIAACDAFCESIADSVRPGPVARSDESWFAPHHDGWAEMPLTGNPEKPYAPDADGKMRAQIGNYHISYAYGGACLHQMMNEGGGIRCPLDNYHGPKRELYEKMQAFARGLELAKQA